MKKPKKKKKVTQRKPSKPPSLLSQKFKKYLLRIQILKDKFFQTHNIRNIIFLLAGFSFIIIGIVLFAKSTWEEDSGGLLDIEKCGPSIQIACDKASQPLKVTVAVDNSGKINLSFMHGDFTHISDEVNFWVFIQDANTAFTWNIETGAEAMSMDALGPRTYLSQTQDKTLGKDKTELFRLTLKKGIFSNVRITLQLDHYCVNDKDVCWVRMPHVFPWYRYDADIDLITSSEESLENPEIINKTMNGDILYAPSLQITAYMDNLEFENPDLSLKSFYPQALQQEAYLKWQEEMIFSPEIKYTNWDWQDELELYETFAGVFLGLGLSFLTIGFKSTEKGTNDEKK